MHYKLFVVGWVVFEEKMSDHKQCIFSGSIIGGQTKYLCTSEKQTVLSQESLLKNNHPIYRKCKLILYKTKTFLSLLKSSCWSFFKKNV